MDSTALPFKLALPKDLPFAFSLHALAAHLQQVPDLRDPRGLRSPLAPLLTLAVLAKLAGHSRREALADWANLRAADLARLFGLKQPTLPPQCMLSRILGHAVDPVTLE